MNEFIQVKNELAALENRLERTRGTYRFWHLLLASTVVFLLCILAAMYAHQRGFIHFGDSQAALSSPPTPSAGAASQPSPTSIKPEKGGGDFRDLLTILIPTFAVAVAFMVGAAGMRRLETYDEEFARSRKERREDAADLRGQLERAQEIFAEQTKASLDAQVKELVLGQVGDVKQLIERQAEAARNSIEQSTHALRDSTEQSVKRTEDIARRLDDEYSLVKLAGSTAELLSLPIIAVGRLEKELEDLFAAGKDTTAVTLVNSCLTKPERLAGEANDWFNVSAELGRRDQEALALKVCLVGLDRCFPSSNAFAANSASLARQDLIAHAISYATKLGDWSQAESLVSTAEAMTRKRWGWRLFTFVGDYLDALGDEQRYFALNADFAEIHPFDERGFSQPAGYLSRLGRVAEAEDFITRGLARPGIRAQQLLGIYSTLLLAQGRYDETIKVSTQALANLADSQPSTATYPLIFRRGASFDAKLMNAFSDAQSQVDGRTMALWLREAIKGYQATLEFGQILPSQYRRQCGVRLALLSSFFLTKPKSDQSPSMPASSDSETDASSKSGVDE